MTTAAEIHTREIETLQAQLDGLLSQNTVFEKTVKTLENDISNVTQQCTALQSALTSAHCEFETLLSAKMALEQQLDLAVTDKDAYVSELRATVTELKHLIVQQVCSYVHVDMSKHIRTRVCYVYRPYGQYV